MPTAKDIAKYRPVWTTQEEIAVNKSQLIAAVAENGGIARKDAEKAVCAFIDVVTNALKENDKVQIMGFGTFEVRERAAHPGINPATMETITVAASKKPVFRAGKALKDAIQ